MIFGSKNRIIGNIWERFFCSGYIRDLIFNVVAIGEVGLGIMIMRYSEVRNFG